MVHPRPWGSQCNLQKVTGNGVLATIQDVNLMMYKNAMINELKEIMHLSIYIGWHIAKSAFADIMTKV